MLKGILKRIGSFLLALIMVLSVLPANHAHAATAHTAHPLCGSSCGCSGTTHSNLSSWTAWDGTTRMYSNGNYYLTKDVVLSSTIILDYSYGSTLCLNGHSITCEDTVFDIYSYRSLWITDCKGTGVIETTGNSCTIGNNKYLSIWGGTIRNSSDWGSAIECYNGTTTYVCGGTVESAGYAAIDAMPGSKVYIQGGTLYANTEGGNFVIDSMGREGYTSKLTVSGGTITPSSSNPNGINWIGGNFTMTGGCVNGNVDTYDATGNTGSTTISGGTINGELYVSNETLSITGGQMQLYSAATDANISAGIFKGNTNIWGNNMTISAGNFTDGDVNVVSPTWIYGGIFDKICVNDNTLYLSGVPSIETLEVKKPNTVSAQNKDNSGSYGGDSIQIQLSGSWSAGNVVVKNVTSDAVAQKFVLADDTGLRYLERSGNNLVLRTIPGGSCGAGASWKYQNGVLTISGTGAITRQGEGRLYPWGDYVDEIQQIVVESGITGIPDYTFEFCENATSITLPDTLISLSLSAFNDCGSLNNLILPAGVVVDPYRNQFIRCESLTDLYFMGTEEEWEAKTSVTPVTSINSAMTVHCLQYYPGTADCVTGGTASYYRFDDTSVYPGYYNAQKQPISQPETVGALGHRVITQQTTTVDPIRVDNTDAVPFTLESGSYYSNNHTHSSSSQIVFTAEQACDLTITYSVSSEYNYDKLYLLHNGSQIAMISGSVTGQSKSVSMSAGDTLTVRYTKDGSQHSGSDRGWFSLSYDQVETTVDVDVPADTLSADCTNAVVCDYCGTVVKPALGHRTVRQQQITVDPIVVENTAATPYSLENGTYYSTNHTHSSSSELRLRAVQACTLQLSYGVSSESNYDYLRIYQNSTQKAYISGSVSSRSLTLTLAQGDVVKVVYSKDVSQSSGSDRGWVKPTYSKVTTTGPVEVVIDPSTLGCSETVACDYCGEEFHGEDNHSFVDNVCSDCGATTGYCGDPTLTDVSWTFDDGVLTIAGTGKMKSYASVNKIYDAIVSIDYLSKPWNSYSVTSGVVEEGVTMLGGGTFRSRSGFTQVSLPDSLKIIDDCAFEECTGLQSITIPENVTNIYEYAFNGCTSLGEITFAGGAPTYIAPYAFKNVIATCYYPAIPSWTAEKRQNYGGNLTWVAYDTCTEGHTWVDATCAAPKTCSVCGETEGEIAADSHNFVSETCTVCGILGGSCGSNMIWTLDTEGNLVLTGTGSIQDYDFGSSPFYKYADRITSVSLPDGLTSIGERAFDATFPNLDHIEIPASVTHIQECAFGATYNKVKLKYPGTMAQWEDLYIAAISSYGQQYGAECSDGTIIYMGPCSGSNGLYDDVQYMLLGDGTLKITGTGDMKFYRYLNYESCFSGDDKITKVVIDEGVTSIAGYAFKNCENLTEVYIPASVTSISYNVFQGCTALTDVYYGSNEKNWNKMSISSDSNEPLAAATIHYTDLCAGGHSWVDATCVAPKTCSVCDATEGDPQHAWVDADCDTPKTCSLCGETEGESLGHDWVDADCETAKTCKVCGETEGEALGHDWLDADCETAKTCKVCGETEGESLGHDWLDADCITPKTCSVCGETEGNVDPAVHAFTNSICTACGAIRIDEITFPDANFRAYITSQTYGADGLLTREEVQNVTSIDVSEKNISDLTGIEHFIELTALVCSDNRLTELNVSKNTELATLWCYNNQLTELDVSKNTELVKFECHNNQLTSLDVSNLTGVEILICSDNQLIALDVSKNTTLTDLLCSDNQLAELDVSSLTALEYLNCSSNQLTELDVSGLTALKNLNCSSNQLTELDVNGLTKLRGLVCFENQLTSLDVDGCTALRSLICDNNQLTSLDVRSLTVLETLDCSSNQLTSLDVSNCTVLEELNCHLNQLTSLNVSGCTALKDLHCSHNQLTDLDVSGCTVLIHLSCSHNQLTDLDVSRCTALEDLNCGHNQLTSLDVSGLAALKILGCSSNQREISVTRNQFDLSKLAADGFNISKASNWNGGTVSGNILTATAEKVTYTYDLGNGETETFTLVIDGLCGHNWTDADCDTPKTCDLCGETEGEALGHDWVDADCETAKTCSRCGETEGEALGHTWVDADCDTPKTCSVCGETEGAPLDHNWTDADCENAKTCTRCGETEGEALGHDWVDADCDTAKTCSVCGETEGSALGHSWVDADCDTPKTCSVCGATEGEDLGHTWVDADCDTPKTCSVCGETEGSALGHTWVDADCDTAKTCSVCGATEGKALGHTEVIDQAVPATCTETGLAEGKHCTVCGAVTAPQQEIPANGHVDLDQNYACDTCGEDLCTDHQEEILPAKAATCTATGLTEGKKCARCGDILVAQQTVPVKAHTEVTDKAVEATCSATGLTEGKHCSACNAVIVAQQVVPAKGHTEVTDKAVAATCTTAGKTEGKHCSACNTVLVAQQTVAAIGHNWKAATCSTPKTCTLCAATSGHALGHDWAAGNCTTPKTCKTCGAKDGGVVHAYEHQYDYKCDLCGTERIVDMTRPMVDMFRMYNPNTGEHFYTGSTEERDNLIAVGWQYEGVGFTFPLTTGKPVHRLFQPSTGEHLYTMDEAEKDKLMAEGWNYEGIAFNSGFENEVPQYRLHNPNATVGAYHFTASLEEKNNLLAAGWEYQGIGWYSLGA